MYLIDKTYFQGVLKIPNIDEMNSTALTNLEELIDSEPRLILRNCLPTEQFTNLDSYIDQTTGVLDPSSPQKWLNLVNGIEYTNQYGTQSIWKGLIYSEGKKKQSMLAWITYYYYLAQEVSFLSGVGEVRAEAKNAFCVNSTSRLTTTWNTFLSMYQGNYNPCFCGLNYELNHIGLYRWDKWNRTISNYEISLLQFLSENPTDYPDLKPVIYQSQNVWGI